MDRDVFDGFTKLLAASPSRRQALGVLLGVGVTGFAEAAAAAPELVRAAVAVRAEHRESVVELHAERLAEVRRRAGERHVIGDEEE